MPRKMGILKDLLIGMNNEKSDKDEAVQRLHKRFGSYVEPHGRAVIGRDLARALYARKMITAPEADRGARMAKVLMVAAVVECAIMLSFTIDPLLKGIV